MPEHRPPETYHDTADAVADLPGVISASAIEHDARLGRPSIEILIDARYSRVPPRVLRVLADRDMGLRDVKPRGAWPERHIVVVAV